MDVGEHISNLVAKRLANEATRKELGELNGLLRKNPGIKDALKNIFDTWEIVSFDNTLSEKEIEENIATVLLRIHERINCT